MKKKSKQFEKIRKKIRNNSKKEKKFETIQKKKIDSKQFELKKNSNQFEKINGNKIYSNKSDIQIFAFTQTTRIIFVLFLLSFISCYFCMI